MKITYFICLALIGCVPIPSPLENLSSAKTACESVGGVGEVKDIPRNFPEAPHRSYICTVNGHSYESIL